MNEAGRTGSQATFRFFPTPRRERREAASRAALPELAPEPRALEVLTRPLRRLRERQLPELLPFPFRADDRPHPPRKRNYGKVPRPSKFIQGEMYFSEYESDFEGRILPKWKPGWKSYGSDTEAAQPLYR